MAVTENFKSPQKSKCYRAPEIKCKKEKETVGKMKSMAEPSARLGKAHLLKPAITTSGITFNAKMHEAASQGEF